MIYWTGDLHGDYDIAKLKLFSKEKDLTKNDFLIIAGDFGLVWYPPKHPFFKRDLYWLNWLSNKSFTTLFIPGNHDNYELLNSDLYQEEDLFGNKVKKIYNSIYMLERGKIYTIDGLKIFAFGGAQSIDKYRRKEGVSWWSQELPSYEEEIKGLQVLEESNNKVDIILTHATHKKMFDALGIEDINGYKDKSYDPMVKYLTEIQERTNYTYWINGHYHVNLLDLKTKTYSLYNLIISHNEVIKRLYQ